MIEAEFVGTAFGACSRLGAVRVVFIDKIAVCIYLMFVRKETYYAPVFNMGFYKALAAAVVAAGAVADKIRR